MGCGGEDELAVSPFNFDGDDGKVLLLPITIMYQMVH